MKSGYANSKIWLSRKKHIMGPPVYRVTYEWLHTGFSFLFQHIKKLSFIFFIRKKLNKLKMNNFSHTQQRTEAIEQRDNTKYGERRI